MNIEILEMIVRRIMQSYFLRFPIVFKIQGEKNRLCCADIMWVHKM